MNAWPTPPLELARWTLLDALRDGAETRWIAWRSLVAPPATDAEVYEFASACAAWDWTRLGAPEPFQPKVRA